MEETLLRSTGASPSLRPMTQTLSNLKASRGHWWWLVGTAALVAAAAGGCYAWASRPYPMPAKAFVLRDDFEGAADAKDLINPNTGIWFGMELEGGKKPTSDSQVSLTTERTRSGKHALKCVASGAEGKMLSKADLECGGLKFKKGDHVWFSGWFLIPEGTDASKVFLWDLETTQLRNSPGRRLFLQDGESVASDLGKWWGGKAFRQPQNAEVKFPKDRWVQLKVHLLLSEGNDGLMQVWQDGKKILDATGKTLPRAGTIYDRMQVGVTANARANRTQTVYVDDVVISNRPI